MAQRNRASAALEYPICCDWMPCYRGVWNWVGQRLFSEAFYSIGLCRRSVGLLLGSVYIS